MASHFTIFFQIATSDDGTNKLIVLKYYKNNKKVSCQESVSGLHCRPRHFTPRRMDTTDRQGNLGRSWGYSYRKLLRLSVLYVYCDNLRIFWMFTHRTATGVTEVTNSNLPITVLAGSNTLWPEALTTLIVTLVHTPFFNVSNLSFIFSSSGHSSS